MPNADKCKQLFSYFYKNLPISWQGDTPLHIMGMRAATPPRKEEKMERNENGYPTPVVEDCPENDEATLHGMRIGYAYVPIQRFRMLYTPEDALKHGTLFEELYMPLGVYGNE